MFFFQIRREVPSPPQKAIVSLKMIATMPNLKFDMVATLVKYMRQRILPD